MKKGDIVAYLDQFGDGDEITLYDLAIMFDEFEREDAQS